MKSFLKGTLCLFVLSVYTFPVQSQTIQGGPITPGGIPPAVVMLAKPFAVETFARRKSSRNSMT